MAAWWELYSRPPVRRSLTQFVTDTLQMFALSALAALIVVFICVYYITGRMVRPIRQMVAATESFSKGDFSARVPVGGFR